VGEPPIAGARAAEPPEAQRADEGVAVVVVTYNAEPWLRRCLESVRAYPTVVVDHGSSDGSLETASRFAHVRVVRQENKGVGAGWNRGLAETAEKYVLLLNADAWVLGPAVKQLRAFAEERSRAALVAPRLLNPDGTLQRSARGFPTPWRLATEFFFLRKLAPRSRVLNAFYAANWDHASAREVEWLSGAAMLVRRAAVDDVGPVDESFFMFNEESDWQYRMRQAGWEIWFCPDAEVVHVGGGSTHREWGRMFSAQVRSHVLFVRKHKGAVAAGVTRGLLLVSLLLRSVVFRGARGRSYREAARALTRAS
jgi:N-acetylglucosaminyl-diphospho-decaprenol L-rhamnosyltransferase